MVAIKNYSTPQYRLVALYYLQLGLNCYIEANMVFMRKFSLFMKSRGPQH